MLSFWPDPDLLKSVISFAGAAAGAFTGIYVKERLERNRQRGEELQTRWLPLMAAAEELERKLNILRMTTRATSFSRLALRRPIRSAIQSR